MYPVEGLGFRVISRFKAQGAVSSSGFNATRPSNPNYKGTWKSRLGGKFVV